MARIFDVLASILGLIVLSPLFLILAIFIKLDSKGPVYYKQQRVGKNNEDFLLYKFRTMGIGADQKGPLITVGNDDNRITKIGGFLRKYKIDELPQLINVLVGDMGLVGPRPEVRRYVDLYSENQMQVLQVKPGITDVASIEFSDENELLKQQTNPEEFYINEVMPRKLELNLQYLKKRSLYSDMKVILDTILKILK